jgi:hypothetical protein
MKQAILGMTYSGRSGLNSEQGMADGDLPMGESHKEQERLFGAVLGHGREEWLLRRERREEGEEDRN